MDYEKNYKDAFSLAKDWYNDTTTSEKERRLLAAMFHELKESEDEKTRKWCIEHFKECFRVSKDNLEYRQYLNNKIIPWLERQKEPKPVISDEAIREGVAHFGITQYQINNWLKKHINVVEQKPAEWSDEDEFFRQQLIVYCEKCVQDTLATKCVDWLKSLRPQPKEEWSEEDEVEIKALDSIIRYIVEVIDKDVLERFGTNYEELFSWLKSLHPQPHWKPSEEQMSSLRQASIYYKSGKIKIIGKTLESLYEELKKLM